MKRTILVISIALAAVCVIALMRATAVPGKYPTPTIDGVALVNRDVVSKEEFKDYVRAAIARKHFSGGSAPTYQLEEIEGLLNSYIRERILIYQDAKDHGIYESEDFQRAYELAENRLLTRKYGRTKLRELLVVTDEDLADIIPSKWVQLWLRQILLSNKGEAEAVLARIRAGGDFIELLRERSIGPGAARDGDLGYKFPGSGYFSPADDHYLFTLEKGDISDVVETPLGPAIVKVEDKKVFNEREIQAMLNKPRGVAYNQKVQDHVREIRENIGAEIYTDALYKCVEAMEDGRKKDALIAKAGDREFYFFDLQRTISKPYDQIFIEPDVKKLFELYRSNLNDRVSDYLMAQEARMFGVKVETDWERMELEKHRRTVAIRLEGERVFAGLEVADDEAEDYFRENLAEFNIAERLRMWQIFLKDESTANLVHDKLLAGGSFRKLAIEYTEDERGRKDSGLIGTLTRNDMFPEIAEAAFALVPGDFSEVVKTDLGYHILTVDATFSARTFAFDEISGKVRKAVLRGKQQERFTEYVEALYSKAAIEVNDTALRELIADLKSQKPEASPHGPGGIPIGGSGASSPHGSGGMPTGGTGASPHGAGGMIPIGGAGASPHGSGGTPPHGP